MEIDKKIVDLWGILGGVAGSLALIVAILMYLLPLTDKPALRRGRKLFLVFLIMSLVLLAYSKGWFYWEVHAPIWKVMLAALCLVEVTYLLARPKTKRVQQPREETFTFFGKNDDDVLFYLIDGEAQLPPICKKHQMEMINTGYSSLQQWRCREASCQLNRMPFTWDRTSRGSLTEDVEARMNAHRRINKKSLS